MVLDVYLNLPREYQVGAEPGYLSIRKGYGLKGAD
jgi:hypothetical protein